MTTAPLLPAPLVPAYVDLTNFDDMPLDVRKLRESRMVATVPAEAAIVNVILWCASWHQLPAGSLPNDDIDLCNLAGFGRMVAHWKEVQAAGAMYGFVKCSDGRWYHKVVSEVALVAWRRKRQYEYDKFVERTRKANHKLGENHPELKTIPEFEAWDSVEMAKLSTGKAADSSGTSAGSPAISPISPENSAGKPPDRPGIPPETALNRTERKGTERNGEERNNTSAPATAPPADVIPDPPEQIGDWANFFTRLGFDAGRVHSVKCRTLLKIWADRGVTQAQMLEAMEVAKASLGHDPSSPTYYAQIVQDLTTPGAKRKAPADSAAVAAQAEALVFGSKAT